MVKRKQEDIIRHSYARCMASGVERRHLVRPTHLSEIELQNRLLIADRLIVSAESILSYSRGYFGTGSYALVIADSEGYILKEYGDYAFTRHLSRAGFGVGVKADEDTLGTNAIGTTLFEKEDVLLRKGEHFLHQLEEYAAYGSVIADGAGGISGVLALFCKAEQPDDHAPKKVKDMAALIAGVLKREHQQSDLKGNVTILESILNALNNGIIAIDAQGKVIKMNDTALKLLRITADELKDKHICRIIPGWNTLNSTLARQESVFDEEVVFANVPAKEKYAVNLFPIVRGGLYCGAVIQIREMSRVYTIVNKFTGMSARYTFEDIIGESFEMQRVVEYAKIVANSPSTILIEGESGTGKELLAQSIHTYSNRGRAGFVAVNCGALPESLIESELFGYDDGAFTGARKGGKPGKFELANGGTLFLDEIGEMPLEMQVKLLRAIQEGVITRVGGSKEIAVDVRIIAATNRDLKEEIKKGKFRLDLYYRLSVIPLKIPSLRERKEDIPMLISYFLHSKALKLNKDVPDISPEVYRFLLNYSWPGNVRELENFIEKTVNLNGEIVWDVTKDQLKHLPDVGTVMQRPQQGKATIVSLEEMEKRMINEALKELEGNISQIAKALGISRNTLYLKMKKYGIEH